MKGKCSVKSDRIVAYKNMQVFTYENKKTNCSRRVFKEISFSMNGKKVREKFWKWSDIVQIGLDSFSPAPVFVI